jgi:hypothetical protein
MWCKEDLKRQRRRKLGIMRDGGGWPLDIEIGKVLIISIWWSCMHYFVTAVVVPKSGH